MDLKANMDQIEKEILELFRKNNLKEGGLLPPSQLESYISNQKHDTVHDSIDDLITRGFLLEGKLDDKYTFKLTKHGADYLYS